MDFHFDKIQPLGEVIRQFVKENGYTLKLNEASINRDWPRIVGDNMAKYTNKLHLQGRSLFIRVKSAPMRQELQMKRSQLISRINSFYHYKLVDEIILR